MVRPLADWRPLLLAVLLLVGTVSLGGAYAQAPYRLTWGKGLAVGGAAATTIALGEYYSARLELLREDQLAGLDAARDVWALDRLATRQRSATAKAISDVTGYGSMLLPLALLAGGNGRDYVPEWGAVYAQAFALNYGLTSLTKNTVRRSRPYVYDAGVPLADKQVRDARRSFFSGHTSLAAVNCYFTAQAFSDLYPASPARGWVWAGAAAVPAVTGLTRVLAGKHYWTDVAVGYAVGAGVGLLVPRLYRRD